MTSGDLGDLGMVKDGEGDDDIFVSSQSEGGRVSKSKEIWNDPSSPNDREKNATYFSKWEKDIPLAKQEDLITATNTSSSP